MQYYSEQVPGMFRDLKDISDHEDRTLQLTSFFQDMQCVRDCDTNEPKLFEQPVIQT